MELYNLLCTVQSVLCRLPSIIILRSSCFEMRDLGVAVSFLRRKLGRAIVSGSYSGLLHTLLVLLQAHTFQSNTTIQRDPLNVDSLDLNIS